MFMFSLVACITTPYIYVFYTAATIKMFNVGYIHWHLQIILMLRMHLFVCIKCRRIPDYPIYYFIS